GHLPRGAVVQPARRRRTRRAGPPAARMSALLEVEALRVEFPGVIAVNGLSFQLGEDEVLAIVGESGCGKTVTGLSVLGLEPRGARVTGHVRFRGTDLRMTDAKFLRDIRGREIAMVFQEPMTS